MKLAAVALVAALGCGATGCGVDSIRARGGEELILADPVTETHYRLSVADGAVTLTGIGSQGTVATEAGLVDGVTGARYSLAVNGGALMLVRAPDSGTNGAGPEIGLADTETAKAYELAVASGALTLVPTDGGGR